MDIMDSRVLREHRLLGQSDTIRSLGAYLSRYVTIGAMQSAICACFCLCRCKGQQGYYIDGFLKASNGFQFDRKIDS